MSVDKETHQLSKQICGYLLDNKIEELTYLAGASLMALELLGCPSKELRLQLEKVVDKWANSNDAPKRR